jgi:hypothetical protein
MILFPFGLVRNEAGKPNQPLHLDRTAQPKTTAERVAQNRGGAAVSRSTGSRAGATSRKRTVSQENRLAESQKRRVQRQIEEEEKRSRMTTIAIVSCSIVAVIAIAIFLIALMSGALFRTEMVVVPDLLGDMYHSGLTYEDLIIKAEHSYNEQYANGIIFEQTPAGKIEVVKGTVIKVSVSMGPEPDIKYMETLRGQKEEDARSFLIGQGMNPLSFSEYNDEYEEGRVIRTDPEAGQPLSDGQTVKIYVSKGPMVEMAKMPSLVGMSLRDALEQLDALGLTNYRFEYVDSEREKDEVINQSVTKFSLCRVCLYLTSSSIAPRYLLAFLF